MKGKNTTTGESAHDARKRTTKQEDDLKALKYKVQTIWGCEFQQVLSRDAEAKTFVDGLDIQTRLDPR